MLGCQPVRTPLDLNYVTYGICINENDVFLENINEYQKLIGKLIYFTITRPNISNTLQTLSRFMHSPIKSHLNVVFRVLRY